MSIATVKAVINGQTYPLTLAEDGYYTLSGTAPALSSANEPGGYYGVQIIATDEAGNETTINQEDGTWGEQLRLVAYESVKPTATITYPSADSRINTCTPTITAQLRDNDSGVDPATLDLRINGGSKITQGAPGLTLTPVEAAMISLTLFQRPWMRPDDNLCWRIRQRRKQRRPRVNHLHYRRHPRRPLACPRLRRVL